MSGWQQRLTRRAYLLAQECLELSAGDGAGTEARQMPRGQLAVDGHDRIASAQRDQVRERGLGGIPRAAEHRLAEEPTTQAPPVKTADQRAGAPHLDAVAVAQPVQLEIRSTHFDCNPGARARGPRCRTTVDHAGKLPVDRDVEAAVAHRLGEAT